MANSRFAVVLVIAGALGLPALARADAARLVKDYDFSVAASSSPERLTTVGGSVYFQACTQDGCELWKSDGPR